VICFSRGRHIQCCREQHPSLLSMYQTEKYIMHHLPFKSNAVEIFQFLPLSEGRSSSPFNTLYVMCWRQMNSVSCLNRGFPKVLTKAKAKNQNKQRWKQLCEVSNKTVT
jgi:hypothetical protein